MSQVSQDLLLEWETGAHSRRSKAFCDFREVIATVYPGSPPKRNRQGTNNLSFALASFHKQKHLAPRHCRNFRSLLTKQKSQQMRTKFGQHTASSHRHTFFTKLLRRLFKQFARRREFSMKDTLVGPLRRGEDSQAEDSTDVACSAAEWLVSTERSSMASSYLPTESSNNMWANHNVRSSAGQRMTCIGSGYGAAPFFACCHGF